MIREIGPATLNQLSTRFDAYLQYLKTTPVRSGNVRKANTVNHYITVGKIICRFAVKHELLPRNPLDRFDKEPEEGRDRVLSQEETERLLKVLKVHRSYLYWPVRFALKNPIRPGDLFSVKTENYDLNNGWVHFYASKTKKRRYRETCLVCIDDGLRTWFISLPDGSYLFPHNENGDMVHSFRTHWETMLKEAEIDNFHFHDLKHRACAYMRDAGFTELDFENLGISYTRRMMQLYYKHDVLKALARWRGIQAAQCEGVVKASQLKIA